LTLDGANGVEFAAMSRSPGLCVRVLGAALVLCLFAPVGAVFAQDPDATVDMVSLSFTPAVIHVSPGATVQWTNSSPLAHTVTADDGSFDSGSIDPDSTFSTTFDAPGTYQYFCQPHGSAGLHGMAATVIVDDPTAGAAPKPAIKPTDPNPPEYFPDH
jgi:plastocyanin